MSAVAQADPWRLVAGPAAAERIEGLGVGVMALAAAYRAVRAAQPR